MVHSTLLRKISHPSTPQLAAVDNHPVTIRIDALRPADSPRLKGISSEHARLLADSAAPAPPILVQKGTMRVIDGMHRVRGAQLRGKQHIAARLVDCDDDESFMQAVRMNLAHGLPLTLADRKAAARRIIQAHPTWSDRAIANSAGLSDKTVGAVRRRLGDKIPRSRWRMGRDGRRRALAVRAKEDAVPGKPAGALLPRLLKDPSLRYTDAGRTLLCWLHGHHPPAEGSSAVVAALPAHCLPVAAQLCRQRALGWASLAKLLEDRCRARTG